MVAIIENYASIKGQIIAIHENELIVQVDELKNHQHYPNLIKLNADNQLKILMSTNDISALSIKKDDYIIATIRAAGGNKYFLKPGGIEIID